MIGVFDSGSGGLTILRTLTERLPDQDFLYLGDHGNAPYGHRSNEQIVEFTKAGVIQLMDTGCSLVILACNTAAAVALRSLQESWLPAHHSEKRILGVLVPMVEAITGLPWSHQGQTPDRGSERILLLATQKTVNSGAYKEEIYKRAPHVELLQKACPGLVDAIEGGAGPAPLRGMIDGYINEVDTDGVSTVVLGCTHFPLVEDHFKAALPEHVSILSQPEIVAAALVDYLERHKGFEKTGEGRIRLLTTGDPTTVNAVSDRFMDDKLEFISTAT